MQCELCKKEYKHLGSHVWHAHKILARDYKMQFGLDLNTPLMEEYIIEKKRKAFWDNPTLENLTTKHQFKKGHNGIKTYYSRASKERIQKQYQKYLNKDHSGQCKICKHKVKHIYSHYYNAHGVLIIDRNKLNN